MQIIKEALRSDNACNKKYVKAVKQKHEQPLPQVLPLMVTTVRGWLCLQRKILQFQDQGRRSLCKFLVLEEDEASNTSICLECCMCVFNTVWDTRHMGDYNGSMDAWSQLYIHVASHVWSAVGCTVCMQGMREQSSVDSPLSGHSSVFCCNGPS